MAVAPAGGGRELPGALVRLSCSAARRATCRAHCPRAAGTVAFFDRLWHGSPWLRLSRLLHPRLVVGTAEFPGRAALVLVLRLRARLQPGVSGAPDVPVRLRGSVRLLGRETHSGAELAADSACAACRA